MREGSIVWKSLHLESKGFRRRYLISYDKRITRAYQTGGGVATPVHLKRGSD